MPDDRILDPGGAEVDPPTNGGARASAAQRLDLRRETRSATVRYSVTPAPTSPVAPIVIGASTGPFFLIDHLEVEEAERLAAALTETCARVREMRGETGA